MKQENTKDMILDACIRTVIEKPFLWEPQRDKQGNTEKTYARRILEGQGIKLEDIT